MPAKTENVWFNFCSQHFADNFFRSRWSKLSKPLSKFWRGITGCFEKSRIFFAENPAPSLSFTSLQRRGEARYAQNKVRTFV